MRINRSLGVIAPRVEVKLIRMNVQLLAGETIIVVDNRRSEIVEAFSEWVISMDLVGNLGILFRPYYFAAFVGYCRRRTQVIAVVIPDIYAGCAAVFHFAHQHSVKVYVIQVMGFSLFFFSPYLFAFIDVQCFLARSVVFGYSFAGAVVQIIFFAYTSTYFQESLKINIIGLLSQLQP